MQLGSIGLLQALRRFDPDRGLCFSTYAVPLIAGEIRRFLRDDGMVKFSRETKSLAIRIERVRREQGDLTVEELSKELNVPVITASQLSRANESRQDKRPMLSDLRESGSIEQDADVVIGLYRDGYYNKESENPNVAEAIILKNRKGQTGTVELSWLGEYTSFTSLERRRDDDL